MKSVGFRCLALGLLAGSLLACSAQPGEAPGAFRKLRVGVLPDESEDALRARHLPLLEHLAKELGADSELTITATYGDLVERFRAGEFDLAYFGGYTFVLAEETAGAVPLVLREIDTRSTSYFLVRNDDARETMEKFQGASFSFGSEFSTSGHLMPRYFLQKRGINPESFFTKVGYSGAHDRTAYRVRDGDVDIGVANAAIVGDMFADGRLSRDEVRVLWQTPSFADYVWAVPADLPRDRALRIREAFLMLSTARETHKFILDRQLTDAFLPATFDDFDRLREIAGQMETPKPAEK